MQAYESCYSLKHRSTDGYKGTVQSVGSLTENHT
jgi:hypothetical protein